MCWLCDKLVIDFYFESGDSIFQVQIQILHL